jgi:hypothetical protein
MGCISIGKLSGTFPSQSLRVIHITYTLISLFFAAEYPLICAPHAPYFYHTWQLDKNCQRNFNIYYKIK